MEIEDSTIIWKRDLPERWDVHRVTIGRMMKNGKLPKPDIHFTQKLVGWKVSTLREAGINV